MNKYVDTHIHSNLSDGSLPVSDIVEIAKKNTSIFSITDHDTIVNPIEIRPLLDKDSPIAIPGIEISAYTQDISHNKILIHILGYGFSQSSILDQLLNKLKENRYNTNYTFFHQTLNRYQNLSLDNFVGIDFGKYCRFTKYMATFLKEHYKDVKNINDALLYLGQNRPVYTDYDVNAKTAIDAIHSANGFAILAHPTEYKIKYNLNRYDLETLVKKMISYGIDGIEAFYSESDSDDMKFLHHLSQKYNLLYSCGSDFHHPESTKIIGYGINNNLCISETSLTQKIIQNGLFFNHGGSR